jgi:hypothetical protein
MSNNALSIIKEILIRALWFPSLVFIVFLLISRVFGIYDKLQGLDILIHFLGGFSIAFCFSEILTILSRRELVSSIDRNVRTVLIFSLTATAAVFWEFAEFAFDNYFGAGLQLDLQDTIWDMAFGILGGLLFIILWHSMRKD